MCSLLSHCITEIGDLKLHIIHRTVLLVVDTPPKRQDIVQHSSQDWQLETSSLDKIDVLVQHYRARIG